MDDSRTIRNIQKNVLKQIGHEDVVEANDGMEALTAINADRPDLVLVDWNMPNMDGLTLVKEVRETNKTLPMIMVTTEVEKSRVVEALKAGVNNYLAKPFEPKTLAQKIKQTMEKAGVPA